LGKLTRRGRTHHHPASRRPSDGLVAVDAESAGSFTTSTSKARLAETDDSSNMYVDVGTNLESQDDAGTKLLEFQDDAGTRAVNTSTQCESTNEESSALALCAACNSELEHLIPRHQQLASSNIRGYAVSTSVGKKTQMQTTNDREGNHENIKPANGASGETASINAQHYLKRLRAGSV
jgi:hypothetical protein